MRDDLQSTRQLLGEEVKNRERLVKENKHMKNELKRMQDELDRLRGSAATDPGAASETVPPPQIAEVWNSARRRGGGGGCFGEISGDYLNQDI